MVWTLYQTIMTANVKHVFRLPKFRCDVRPEGTESCETASSYVSACFCVATDTALLSEFTVLRRRGQTVYSAVGSGDADATLDESTD